MCGCTSKKVSGDRAFIVVIDLTKLFDVHSHQEEVAKIVRNLLALLLALCATLNVERGENRNKRGWYYVFSIGIILDI